MGAVALLNYFLQEWETWQKWGNAGAQRVKPVAVSWFPVGDIVKLHANHSLPYDMVLLSWCCCHGAVVMVMLSW